MTGPKSWLVLASRCLGNNMKHSCECDAQEGHMKFIELIILKKIAEKKKCSIAKHTFTHTNTHTTRKTKEPRHPFEWTIFCATIPCYVVYISGEALVPFANRLTNGCSVVSNAILRRGEVGEVLCMVWPLSHKFITIHIYFDVYIFMCNIS